MEKKIEIVCSFSGIPITCRLEMEYFFTQIRNHAVCRVYVTQSRLTRLFHVTCVMSSKREFRCCLSRFHCRNEVKQGHKVQTNEL